MTTKNSKIVFGIIASLFLVFYFFRLSSGIFKIADSFEYLSTSETLKKGMYFIPSNDFTNAEAATKRPILYPIFLLINSIVNIKIVIFIQTLFGILNTYLILKCLEKLKITIHNYIVLIILLTPSIFVYTQLIMSEWLVMTLVLVMTYTFLHEFTKKRFLLIQILTILLALTKPVFFPIIYFNFIYFAIFLYRKKIFSLYLFFPVIFLFSYLKINEYKTGYTHFSSIENINLIDYNLYYYKSFTESQEIADTWRNSVYEKGKQFPTYAARNRYYKETATEEIKSNFWGYSAYHFFTSVRGMIDPGRFDIMTFFKKEDGKQGFIEILNNHKTLATLLNKHTFWIFALLIPIFVMQLIKFICICTFIYQNKLHLFHYRFYPILVAIAYIFLTGPVNCSRLMMPLQGLLIIITVYQLNTLRKIRLYKKKEKL